MASILLFLTNPAAYHSAGNETVGVVGGVNSKEELFAALASALQLPDYFGHNWDALSDMLRDFSWIETKAIALVHTELPAFENALGTYFEILKEAMDSWAKDDGHDFRVVFPENRRARVESLLAM